MRGSGLLMIDGRLAGLWGRSITRAKVAIDVTTSHRLTASLRHSIACEADRFGAFVEREAVVTIQG
jgi:hypothetical protein